LHALHRHSTINHALLLTPTSQHFQHCLPPNHDVNYIYLLQDAPNLRLFMSL